MKAHTKPDLEEVRETFESLEEGDRIELPQYYQNPMTVTFIGESTGMVGVKDDRGNERELIQNKHNPEVIGLIVGTTDKGKVSEINVVN